MTLALTLTVGAAVAQVTPEAVIGRIPPMPSQSDLIRARMASGDSEIPASVRNFDKLVEQAIQDIDDNASKQMTASLPSEAQQRAAADAAARAQTGRSVEQLQGMSQAEAQAMGNAQAAAALRGAGAGGSTNAADMARAMTGMSLEQLEALDKMSEAEQLAALQSGGLDRMMSAARGTRPTQAQTQQARAMQNVDAGQMAAAMQKIQEFQSAILAEKREFERWETEVFDTRYREQLESANRAYSRLQGEGDDAHKAEIEAAIARERALYEAYFTEVVPKWMALCASQRDRAQALISEGRIIDDYHTAATGAAPMTAGAQNQAFTMARLALGCWAGVTGGSTIQTIGN